MALDEALYELTGAGLIACAAGLGIIVPPGAVRAGDALVGFLSQRGAWGEINRLVEELKRDLLQAADATLTTPAGLAQNLAEQAGEAVTVLEEFRPESELLRQALTGPPTGEAAPLIPPATRIAAQMIARAAAAHPPHRHVPSVASPAAGPSHGAQALLHRLLSALLEDPYLVTGFGPALQEFLAVSFQPKAAVPVQDPDKRADQGLGRLGATQPGIQVRQAAATAPAAATNVVGLPAGRSNPAVSELMSVHGLGESFAAGLTGVGVTGTLEHIRAARGLSAGAYGRFLRTLESQKCPPGAAPLRLDEMAVWLTSLIAALTKPSNEDSDTRRLKVEAAKALADGDLEAAVQRLKNIRRSLREGRRRIEERLREDILLLNQQMASEAGVIARQAEMELTRRDYAAAAELFAEARDSLPASELQAAWLYGMRQGEALFRLGDEFDDSQALREATRTYGACLAMTGREEMPKNWAAAQCGLALAYQRLAERDPEPALLGSAIGAWRAALAVLDTLDEPGQTLVSRRHLARALVQLGERESDSAIAAQSLEEAAALYRGLAAAIPRERSATDWAEAQMGLAGALLGIDERSETAPAVETLHEAAAALEAALTHYDRDQNPAEWSQARVSMGNALLAIGERENSLERLIDAARCFDDALERQSRTAAPRPWAQVKMSLANALAAIAEQTADPDRMAAAAATYREALEELQTEDDSLRRAIAELNLGTVLVRLAEHREPHRHRREAMSAMLSALQIFEARQAGAYVRIAQINLRNLHRISSGAAASGVAPAKTG